VNIYHDFSFYGVDLQKKYIAKSWPWIIYKLIAGYFANMTPFYDMPPNKYYPLYSLVKPVQQQNVDKNQSTQNN
jgi:hypothetical protein